MYSTPTKPPKSRLCLVTQRGMYICHICSGMCWWKYCCVALYVLQPSIRSSFPLEIGVWGSFYFAYTPLAAKSRFFRPPVTWRAWQETSLKLALKRGGGNQARGWNVANISSPLRFSRGWKMTFFFFRGASSANFKGRNGCQFQLHLLPVRGENSHLPFLKYNL